jgi:hypothetical protein
MSWIDWIKSYTRDDRFDLLSHDTAMLLINLKKEIVIARVMQTGIPCYPDDSIHGPSCILCEDGPCRGPIEKYEEK